MNFETFFIKEYTIQFVRNYFIEIGFHEVETATIMTRVPIEPNLYPLKTTWQDQNIDFYLATSPESCLKKLIAKGIGDCFAISKSFRDLENIGPTHNLEFTMVEWYEMKKSYLDIIDRTEKMILDVYHKILVKQNRPITNILPYQGVNIDLTPPWNRITLQDAFLTMAGMDLTKNMTTEEIIKTAKEKGYNTDGVETWEPLYTQIFINEIESKLSIDKPTFLLDYPSVMSPLCIPCKNNVGFSERFEFYIGGMELGNGNTELNDAKILEKSFIEETEARKEHGLPLHPYDKKFVEAVGNLPNCAGIGVGIDRLAMLFNDTDQIEDVIYFPTSGQI